MLSGNKGQGKFTLTQHLLSYYFDKEKWIAAINRLQFVVENYDKTIFVEEALHRLVEILSLIHI